jgi:hypothetical protein
MNIISLTDEEKSPNNPYIVLKKVFVFHNKYYQSTNNVYTIRKTRIPYPLITPIYNEIGLIYS